MLIRKLILENFGLYRGRVEIDLAPHSKYGQSRPVVLIGGKNGAGKTTLLEALRLCLYGPLSVGNRVSSREYERYLRSRIHRAEGVLIQSQSAAVGLEFDYAQAGKLQNLRIERRWEATESSVRSQLSVLRGGQELDGLDRVHADEFLRDLIPQGVSQLYFFDGEKIQQLAESDDENEVLATAIRELLGLDLVDTLQADLRVYLGRLDDLQATDPLFREQSEIAAEQSRLRQELLDAGRSHDECQSILDSLRQEVGREEQRISRKGGAFANQREALKAERIQLERAVRESEDEVRALCENLLPFLLCTGLCGSLREQLHREEKAISWQAQETYLRKRIEEIKKSVLSRLFLSGSKTPENEKRRIRRLICDSLDGLTSRPKDLAEDGLVHDLSVQQSRRLLGAIDRITDDLPTRISVIQQKLEQLTCRLRDVERSEKQIPAEDELADILGRLQELHRRLPIAAAAAARADDAVRRIDRRLAELERGNKKLQDRLREVEKSSNRRQTVGRIQDVLEEYSGALTATKARRLSEAVSRRFVQLWRKGDVIRRIEIDPKTFQVTLFDRSDREVRKQELSAGEKQMYAISLLWGLAEISGRPLPMVIDTPLGRLDSDHRSHLVQRYFPRASHQVIILLTDTEVDNEYFKDLSSSLSHAYHVEYDPVDGCSIVKEGYFWSHREKEVAHAS